MMSISLRVMEVQMEQAEYLNNAVTALVKGYAALDEAVSNQTSKLTEAMKNVQQPDPSTAKAITDAITNIESLTGQMAQKASALTEEVPGATKVEAPDVAEPAAEPTVEAPEMEMPPVNEPDATPPDEHHDDPDVPQVPTSIPSSPSV